MIGIGDWMADSIMMEKSTIINDIFSSDSNRHLVREKHSVDSDQKVGRMDYPGNAKRIESP